ncbi:hypothetical protein AGDE_10880 [Angomonas deanei]|uniref:DUF2817 domain-containing protein n=1 Tax=Angomonas deanei TaxID=59799 RepID=A0A7G2CDR6_9TRYP|nr:hypothetical protein AGDE_10880 [Angomonas deanei]CAD2217966.1 Protein of unknown function (DUF2817), putative [Angomonas deanei]|eukprot:EPY27209.1 hypothetical protein AGDE_10880 [Angomonas deanei]
MVVIIGLLFIDLVPLQETMRCEDYTNATECPDVYFAQSYHDARDKFLTAAHKAKAEVESHLVVTRGTVDYYMDTAFIKGTRPDHLLVHVSGTHGVEGYTGSGIQYHLLNHSNETLAQGPSILFLHALNPYGMAQNRRFNENNVDLNRNYLTSEQWKEVLSRDINTGGYEQFRHLLSPQQAPRLIDRYVFLFTAAKSLVQHGYAALKRTFVTGQYHDSKGTYFGGREEQKSITLLREIMKKYSSGVTQSISIHVHSGLGKFGVDTIMTSDARSEELSKVVFPGVKVQDESNANNGAASGYDLAMGIVRPCEELGKNCLSVSQEFGTVNPIFVARALILENAAYHLCPGTYVHQVMATWVRDAFYPQELSYKTYCPPTRCQCLLCSQEVLGVT